MVMVGVTGNPGLWMTVAGMVGTPDKDGLYAFRMANPTTGAITVFPVRENTGALWLSYNGLWDKIGIIVGMAPANWDTKRSSAGADFSGGDGWGFDWNTDSLLQNMLYYMHVTANDQAGHSGSDAVLVHSTCRWRSPAPPVSQAG